MGHSPRLHVPDSSAGETHQASTCALRYLLTRWVSLDSLTFSGLPSLFHPVFHPSRVYEPGTPQSSFLVTLSMRAGHWRRGSQYNRTVEDRRTTEHMAVASGGSEPTPAFLGRSGAPAGLCRAQFRHDGTIKACDGLRHTICPPTSQPSLSHLVEIF